MFVTADRRRRDAQFLPVVFNVFVNEVVNSKVGEINAGPEGAAGLSGYLLPFEIISIHLLVVLIGAAFLARTKRRAGSGVEV